MMENKKREALQFHELPTPGKVKVIPTKPCKTAADLSLAYTPGVAQPCLEIKDHPEDAYKYTSKGNLVAVISNGTAVLGLGNIGALAGKPVMEGKGVLFKRFAGIDVFDIEIDEQDPEKLVEIITSLEPTFGGINLEDIKGPECFFVEQELIKKMNIPVFHDDQHGTAVIASAALLNALEFTSRKIKDCKVVFSGAGAAAIAVANLLLELGAPRKNIFLVDSQGIVTKQRQEQNRYKAAFAQDTPQKTLADALLGADVFIGVSQGNILNGEMLKTMKPKPIIFAMANPVPEISYDEAKKAVPDCIMATGRSDYPNQVNNVLCFPFLFRAALDVRATKITTKMKLAAVHALAALAHRKVPAEVIKAYGKNFSFGSEYIIPKPFDPRVLSVVAPAVAKAAMEEGVAQRPIADLNTYTKELKKLSQRLAKGKF
ncbi:malic enzyme [Candidatus Woesearchaeota archaeon]|nr:malic enzyme [Candidatus Woesearchaeota archaeon]